MMSQIPTAVFTSPLLYLRLRDDCGRGGIKREEPENRGVCCDTVSLRNVGSHTHKVSPTLLPKHGLNKDNTMDWVGRSSLSLNPSQRNAKSFPRETHQLDSQGHMVIPEKRVHTSNIHTTDQAVGI